MRLSGWGNYPVIDAQPLWCHDTGGLKQSLRKTDGLIARGNGRSYGDSALYDRFVPMRRFDRFSGFDENTGLLVCDAGVLLSDIIESFLPRGWFLGVTPGTRLITVGGAIASDVHGKNHHVAGCFSETVAWIDLLTADGNIIRTGPDNDPDLFFATCGGMGLTGIIRQAAFYLKKVPSSVIDQAIVKTRNLEETFAAFEQNAEAPYSVAWIDCLQTGGRLGRALLMTGDFSDDGGRLVYHKKKIIDVPFNLPAFTLNSFSVRAFNALYYNMAPNGTSQKRVDVDSFFYPLDAVGNWNRIYGKRGFVQYQFILPKTSSFSGLEKILGEIARHRQGSFLAVLKLHGPENQCPLSFPLEGYSLALDFKLTPGLFSFLNRLDAVMLDHGGRTYLTKDARVNRDTFEKGYERLESFRAVRDRVDPGHVFRSLQSERLGL